MIHELQDEQESKGETGPRSASRWSVDTARWCINRGWVPVQVPLRTKRPIADAWQKLRPTTVAVARWGECNVGVLLGSASNWLVDVDLDCPEAVTLAPHYLVDTWVFGRKSKPASHWLYRSSGVTSSPFRGTDGKMMLELRGESTTGSGAQTIIPPSIHETGEPIKWDIDHGDAGDAPREIDAKELYTRVARLARACLYMKAGATVGEAIAKVAARRPQRAAPQRKASSSALIAGDVRERARKYIAKMPEAMSQQGGHLATFRAAVVLVRGFLLDEGDALALLRDEFNPRCAPAWSERELQHKVKQATLSRAPAGFLLRGCV